MYKESATLQGVSKGPDFVRMQPRFRQESGARRPAHRQEELRREGVAGAAVVSRLLIVGIAAIVARTDALVSLLTRTGS